MNSTRTLLDRVDSPTAFMIHGPDSITVSMKLARNLAARHGLKLTRFKPGVKPEKTAAYYTKITGRPVGVIQSPGYPPPSKDTHVKHVLHISLPENMSDKALGNLLWFTDYQWCMGDGVAMIIATKRSPNQKVSSRKYLHYYMRRPMRLSDKEAKMLMS